MPQAPSFDKIVVTGGTGFIGQHLLEALVEQGHQPTATVRSIEQVKNLPEALRHRVHWFVLDLLDNDAVVRFIKDEHPTVLFHMAGTRGTSGDIETSASKLRGLNVDATMRLLKASTSVGVQRIIITGTAEEYGDQPGPFDESRPLKPISPYGKSKAEATRLALAMYAEEKCPVVIARLFTVYGPKQPRGMFVRDAVSAAITAMPFSMSEGKQQRDLVFVDDVVAALIAAARTPGIEGNVFNVGNGKPIALRDVVAMIWRISKSDASLSMGTRARSDTEMQSTWANISLAQQRLGWKPNVALEDGLRATIEWARKRELSIESGIAVH